MFIHNNSFNEKESGKIMKKAIEFDLEKEELKKYLEECLTEENMDYEIKIEDRWVQKYKQASRYYQVYCLYVNKNDLNKVKQFLSDFENGSIITDGIEELKNIDEDESDNKFEKFTLKNFLKYYWLVLIIIGILMIIGIKLTSL